MSDAVNPVDVDAVILVGGQGTRLRPLTLSAPKPMLPTAGVPFLSHLLARIAAAGIRHVVLGTSYKAEVFEAEFGEAFRPYFDHRTRRVDLWRLTRDQLVAAGLSRDRIFGLDLCTRSLPLFFSYRRDKTTGRQASLIWIRP